MQQHPYVVLGSPNIEFIVSNDIVRDSTTRAILKQLGPGKHDVDKLKMVSAKKFNMRATLANKRKPRFQVPTDLTEVFASGSAANIAVGLQQLRLSAVLCGAFADQKSHLYSELLFRTLGETGVRILQMDRASTPYSFIVPPDGITKESIVLIFKPGYNIHPNVQATIAAQVKTAEPHCIIASSIRSDELALAKELFTKNKSALRILTPSKAVLHRPHRQALAEVLEKTDLLQMNEEETELFLWGEALPSRHLTREMMDLIAKRAGVQHLIITQAARGASVLIDGEYATCKPYPPKKIVDQSGCGDAFLVGYLWALERRSPLATRLAIASRFAAGVIQRLGSGEGLPTLAEAESFTV